LSHAARRRLTLTRIDTAARFLGEKIKVRKLSSPLTARDVYRPQWVGRTKPDDVARALEALEGPRWLISGRSRSTRLAAAVARRAGDQNGVQVQAPPRSRQSCKAPLITG